MLNYLSGELYKLRRHKTIYIGIAVLLALECLFFALLVQEDILFQRELLEAFFEAALFVGLFIAPIFAVVTFDDQYRNGTMKNEIVYGIPRSHIYFGKLIAGWVVGTLASLLAAGFYWGAAAVISPRPSEEFSLIFLHAMRGFAGHWMTWLSIYSFTFFLLMLFKGAAAAISLVYVVTLFGFPFSMVDLSQGSLPGWFRLCIQLFYTTPLRTLFEREFVLGIVVNGETIASQTASRLVDQLLGSPLLYALGICLLWTVGLSLIGWLLFLRREIK